MKRSINRSSASVLAVALPAAAFTATPVLADVGGVTPNSWGQLFRYAGCALGIAAATTGFGMAAAIVGCLNVLVIDF